MAGGVTTADPAPRFSIVIPTFQRRELVCAHVQAFARQLEAPAFEVIVAVDGATDGTGDALRRLDTPFPLTVLEQPNRGASVARNAGAAAARGEILLFLDDDMEPAPDLLAVLDRSHRDGPKLVFGHLPIHPDSPANFLSRGIGEWTEGRRMRLTSDGAALTLHDLLTGQLSLPRALFQAVGGFDTAFTRDGTFGNEDLDFGYRMMKQGHRLVFEPAAVSCQNYVVTAARYFEQSRQAGHADVAFVRKHPEQAKALFALQGVDDPINRRWWRPLARAWPLTWPVMEVLRLAALRIGRRPFPSDRAVRFFYRVWALEYWRGVQEAGGMPRPRAVTVLAYHAFRDLRDDPILAPYGVPPRRLFRQIRMLQALGCHLVSPDEFLQCLRYGGGLPRRPVLLTIDDGYDDLLSVAPELQALGVPGIVFAVSGRLGGHNTWDVAHGATLLRLATRDELEAVARQGLEIGAHSRTHPMLTQLGPEARHDEITGSMNDLGRLGAPVRFFAYPYGDHDPAVRAATRAAGAAAAFTVTRGRARPGDDPWAVPRIEVLRRDGVLGFLWKVIRA